MRLTNLIVILAVSCQLLAVSCFAQMQVSAQIPASSQSQEKSVEQSKAKEQVDEKYTWDFGKAKEGDILTHTFILKNESSKTLNIKNVNTSCGCTTSEVKKTSLEPGESTDIEVKFNSKGYLGPVQKFIYVNTDDVDNPVIRLIIKADVIKADVVKQNNTEVK